MRHHVYEEQLRRNFKDFRQNIGRDEGALVPTVKGILPPPVHQVKPRSLLQRDRYRQISSDAEDHIKVPFRPFHYCTVYRRSGSVNEESPIPLSYKETSSQSRATQSVRPGASDRKSDSMWYGSRTSRSSFFTHIGGNSYCNSCTEKGHSQLPAVHRLVRLLPIISNIAQHHIYSSHSLNHTCLSIKLAFVLQGSVD